MLLRQSSQLKDPILRLTAGAVWEIVHGRSLYRLPNAPYHVSDVPECLTFQPPRQFTSLRWFSVDLHGAPAPSPHVQRASKPLNEVPAPTPHRSWNATYGHAINFANVLSMARLISGPIIASWILQGQWSIAVPALAVSGATDWLDGYIARRSGHSNVLGSYLDPLADKVLVGSVVGALGYTGALPAPLVGVIIGRDAFLVLGAFAVRARSLGWAWPGVREFFRVAPAGGDGGLNTHGGVVGQPARREGLSQYEDGPMKPEKTNLISNCRPAPVAPVLRPLLISKVNTGLQFILVASCMTDSWLGWPGAGVVWDIGVLTAGTTLWSCAAYARAYINGEMFGVARVINARNANR